MSLLYLNHPPLQRLIGSLPVAEHSVEVRGDRWLEPCRRAGRSDLHAALFAGHPAVRISRGWLHRTAGGGPEAVGPELHLFALLLWGYPTGARTDRRRRWLECLPAIAAADASGAGEWEDYHARLSQAGGLGLSTVSMVAHFRARQFGGQPALILDQRLLALFAAGRWSELAPLRDLTFGNARRRYPDYLRVMHGLAAPGAFTADQLEFFLFALAGAF